MYWAGLEFNIWSIIRGVLSKFTKNSLKYEISPTPNKLLKSVFYALLITDLRKLQSYIVLNVKTGGTLCGLVNLVFLNTFACYGYSRVQIIFSTLYRIELLTLR